jgi:hypothetical protein
MEWLVAARPNTNHAAADLTGHLDNTSMRQNLRLLAGRKLASATQRSTAQAQIVCLEAELSL